MEENIRVYKTSLSTLIKSENILAHLSAFVFYFNRVSAAGWLFASYIFLAELEWDTSWDSGALLDQTFFCEVLRSLIDHIRCAPRVARTKELRDIISRHKDAFTQLYGYKAPAILSAQVCLYQATKMVTAYTNNIALKLGDHIRKTLNHLGGSKQHRDSLRRLIMMPIKINTELL